MQSQFLRGPGFWGRESPAPRRVPWLERSADGGDSALGRPEFLSCLAKELWPKDCWLRSLVTEAFLHQIWISFHPESLKKLRNPTHLSRMALKNHYQDSQSRALASCLRSTCTLCKWEWSQAAQNPASHLGGLWEPNEAIHGCRWAIESTRLFKASGVFGCCL